MEDWQTLWTKAYRYGRKSHLSIEQAQDFAQYVALTRHEGDLEAPLGLLICRFNARGKRGLDRAKKSSPPTLK